MSTDKAADVPIAERHEFVGFTHPGARCEFTLGDDRQVPWCGKPASDPAHRAAPAEEKAWATCPGVIGFPCDLAAGHLGFHHSCADDCNDISPEPQR